MMITTSKVLRSLFTSILLLMTMLGGITLLTGEAQAASVTIIMTLEPSEQWLDFNEGKGSTVTFTGSVAVNISGVGASQTEVVIDLQFWTDDSWEVSIAPTSMTFSYLDPPQNFTATITAPDQIADGQASERIYISGLVTEITMGQVVAEYGTAPVSGVIRIKQFYSMTAWSTEGLKNAPTGSTAVFEITINNLGNGMDTAYVESVDVTPEPASSFLYSYFPVEIDIEAQTSGSISVHIDIPKDLPDGETYYFNVKIMSKGAEESGFIEPEDPVQLVLTVEHVTKGGFDVPVSLVVIVLGSVGVLVLIGVAIVIYMLRREADREESQAKQCKDAIEVTKVVEEK